MTRIVGFIASNLAIVLVMLFISLRLPGVENYLSAQGLNLSELLLLSALVILLPLWLYHSRQSKKLKVLTRFTQVQGAIRHE